MSRLTLRELRILRELDGTGMGHGRTGDRITGAAVVRPPSSGTLSSSNRNADALIFNRQSGAPARTGAGHERPAICAS